MNETFMKTAVVVLFAVLILVMIGVGPFITIWCLNTLFTTGIPFNIWTWLSVFWLSMVANGIAHSDIRLRK